MNKKLTGVSPYVFVGLPKAFLDFVSQEDKAREIIKKCLKFWGVDFSYIQQKCRKREIVLKRQICFYLIRGYTNLQLRRIGEIFTPETERVVNKYYDHSTVFHA